jgi:hypothetical protein
VPADDDWADDDKQDGDDHGDGRRDGEPDEPEAGPQRQPSSGKRYGQEQRRAAAGPQVFVERQSLKDGLAWRSRTEHHMWDGGGGSDEKSYGYYVWPVRSGQTGPLGCSTWSDVIGKYNSYVSGQATWTDVINCYNEYVS